jgi:hypothetical protein
MSQRRFQFKALHSCFSIVYFAFVFGFGVSNPESETNRKSVFCIRKFVLKLLAERSALFFIVIDYNMDCRREATMCFAL